MLYGRSNTGIKIGAGFMLIVIVLIGITFGTMVGIPGCRNQFKHMQSSMMGLDRKATVYSYTGEVITSYEGRFKIEETSDYKTKFTLNDGRSVYISGGITIIEEKE